MTENEKVKELEKINKVCALCDTLKKCRENIDYWRNMKYHHTVITQYGNDDVITLPLDAADDNTNYKLFELIIDNRIKDYNEQYEIACKQLLEDYLK